MHVTKFQAILPLISNACHTTPKSTAGPVLLSLWGGWKHDLSLVYSTSSHNTASTGDGQASASPDSDSSLAGASNHAHTTSQDGPTHDQQQQASRRENAYRRGFGAKVALPARDVLQEVLVSQPATFKLRAYHIGKRIHIGQILQRAAMRGCRTNYGKDYCVIWLNSAAVKSTPQGTSSAGTTTTTTTSSSNSSSSSSSRASQQQQQQQNQWEAFFTAAALSDRMKTFVKAQQQRHKTPQGLQAAQAPAKPQQQQQQQQQNGIEPLSYVHHQQAPSIWPGLPSSVVPPMLVVYRYGSVVFAGTPVAQEPELIDRYVPMYVRYKAGGEGNSWAMRDPMLESQLPQEEQTVVVKPDATEPAVKGVDKVQLRVLDVGSVRVLTSVLGQSVALKFYEASVTDALDKLSQWRARTRRAASYQRTAGLGIIAGSQEQTTLFKVIAASALIINEARELLEMAEPAWQYSTYHSIWSLAADDFELEKRFRALETKLHKVEEEAKHDVKQREGRKYYHLEQSVILLLVVSCLVAILHQSKKLLNSSTSSSTEELAVDAAAAGLSVEEGSLTDVAVDAVQQLQLQAEDHARDAAAAAVAAPEAVAGCEDAAMHGDEVAVGDWDSSSSSEGVSDSGVQNSSSSSTGVAGGLRKLWWTWGRNGSK